MDVLWKNRREDDDPGLPCRGRPFSLVRFFWASKSNELARLRGETLLILPLGRGLASVMTDQRPGSTLKIKGFRLGGFISFDKRQKKRSKEKRFPVQGKLGGSVVKGFFYTTSLSCRKTPHILVRRPPGLQPPARFFVQKTEAEAKKNPRTTEPYSASA